MLENDTFLKVFFDNEKIKNPSSLFQNYRQIIKINQSSGSNFDTCQIMTYSLIALKLFR